MANVVFSVAERLRPTTPRVATPPTTPTTTLISYKVHFQPQIVGKADIFLIVNFTVIWGDFTRFYQRDFTILY